MKSPAFIEEKTGPPVIDLGEIRLRPLRHGDEHSLFEYLTDPRVIEHTSIPLLGLDALAAGVERDIAAYDAGISCRWALAAADDRLIGICGFNNWSFVHEHAELAYDLNPFYGGCGYMRPPEVPGTCWPELRNLPGGERIQPESDKRSQVGRGDPRTPRRGVDLTSLSRGSSLGSRRRTACRRRR